MIFGFMGKILQDKFRDRINNLLSEKKSTFSRVNLSEMEIYYSGDECEKDIKKFNFKNNGLFIDGDLYKSGGDDSTPEGVWKSYRKNGISFLEKLNGSFVLALCDADNELAVLASDKMNTKPFFYSFEKDGVVFSSDLKFLSMFLKRTVNIEPLVLMKYLTFCYNPGSQTFSQGIQRLLPGHFLLWKRGTGSVKKYWSLSFRFQTRENKEKIGENIREKLTEAVRIRINDKEKIGVFLSGGLDSSSIVSLLSLHSKKNMSCYSFRCQGKSFDESVYAKIVADNFTTGFNLIEYSPEDVLKAEPMVKLMDEPFCDVGINIATYLLSEFAAGKVTHLFTGDGGDELFAGHPVYVADKMARMINRMPRFLMKPVFKIGANLKDSEKKKDFRVKFKRFSESYSYPDSLGTHKWRVYYHPRELRELLKEDLWSNDNPENIYDDVIQYNKESDGRDALSISLASDYQTVVQFYVRRMAIARAFGLRPKMPMLDPELAEYCASVPSKLKIKGMSDVKYIERLAVDPLLPKEIVYRKDKLGHSIPLKNWMRENKVVKDFILDLLSEETIRRRGLFQPERVQQMIRAHMNWSHNHSHRLWAMSILELWLRSRENNKL